MFLHQARTDPPSSEHETIFMLNLSLIAPGEYRMSQIIKTYSHYFFILGVSQVLDTAVCNIFM